jgi:hypothetical protein
VKRIIIFLLFAQNVSFAQNNQLVSIALNNASVTEFVKQVEQQTSYRFFYLDSWVDTVSVSIQIQKQPVSIVLEKALLKTGINFTIIDDRIFLTPHVKIITDLSYSGNFGITLNEIQNSQKIPEGEASLKNETIQIGINNPSRSGSATLTGYIKEKVSGEPMAGVVIYSKKNYATSDSFGFYSLTLPTGIHLIDVRLIGMKDVQQKINLSGDGKLTFLLEESVTVLNEIVVEGDNQMNVSSVQMGLSRIDMKSIKNIPKILGENDVMKVALTMPGVKTIGEGASGIHVRGGHADQNLVILNEATIYNPSHFLGFFSVFNADAIRSFELYKSGIPVQHGGRLSSIFELLMRDGNTTKFSGQGGIGPITSHLTLELPLVKNRTTIMVGGRTTYSNWILKQIPKSEFQNSSASFYDYFTRITHKVNDKNSLYFLLYASHDQFNLSSDSLFSYNNFLGSLQWRHVFSKKLNSLLSATHSQYKYRIDYKTIPEQAFKIGFDMRESNIKWENNWSTGNHKIDFGVQTKLYQLEPGFVNKNAESSIIKERVVDPEKGLETAIFVADQFDLTPSMSLYAGIRYSTYFSLGPRSIFQYEDGRPKTLNTISDTTMFGKNKVVDKYHGPEYRVSARYRVSEQSSVKASYNRTRQYIHMLTNTVSVSPTDTWKLADRGAPPQVADQVSIGYYRDLRDKTLEFSVETYYKRIQNILDYKTGAALLVNEHIEQAILKGDGKAYGIELLLRKKSGKLNGWLGYSYSRTFIRLASPIIQEQVNGGKYFPANYDKPHDVSVVANYKITRRYSLSMNFSYSTGRPITFPVGTFRFGNTYRINYSDRNEYRIPDYIRMDVGFNMEGNHKIKKLAHSYWNISVYNLLGRKNPYSVYFKVEDQDIKSYQLSIFGVPIPTITYHFKF